MQRKQHTVELAPARQADGDIMPPAAAALMQPQYRPHVVQATNDALPPHAWIVATVIVVAVPSVTAGFMLLLGAPGWLSLSAWFALVSVAVYWTLQLMSGDWAAMREIKQNNTTERHRVREVGKVAGQHYALEQAKEANRHEEEMARIATYAESDTMHRLIMGMQAQLARLADAHELTPVQVHSQTFVPATPSEAVTAAKRWVNERMADSPDGITAPNLANVSMPWNSAWKQKPWSGDARQWLLDNVLEQQGTVYRWREEFATVAGAVDELRRL